MAMVVIHIMLCCYYDGTSYNITNLQRHGKGNDQRTLISRYYDLDHTSVNTFHGLIYCVRI